MALAWRSTPQQSDPHDLLPVPCEVVPCFVMHLYFNIVINAETKILALVLQGGVQKLLKFHLMVGQIFARCVLPFSWYFQVKLDHSFFLFWCPNFDSFGADSGTVAFTVAASSVADILLELDTEPIQLLFAFFIVHVQLDCNLVSDA